jgi:hypothetical protein
VAALTALKAVFNKNRLVANLVIVSMLLTMKVKNSTSEPIRDSQSTAFIALANFQPNSLARSPIIGVT